MPEGALYARLLERVFFKKYTPGDARVEFERQDIVDAAREIGARVPKNIGDVIYSFRYRTDLPESISDEAPGDREWVIRPAGKGAYAFCLTETAVISPRENLVRTKVPDATPGVIDKYALSDEQAILAKIRYNRLIDLFTGLTCYSLQNHLRTFVEHLGQTETD
jgi:hypothetical protein